MIRACAVAGMVAAAVWIVALFIEGYGRPLWVVAPATSSSRVLMTSRVITAPLRVTEDAGHYRVDPLT